MSDDISNEIQRVVNNIEDDRSRRRRLQSDIEDLYRGCTSLEDQVERLSEENRHYRKQFEKAVRGIDRQLEKNEHRLDTHERRLDGFRSDLDYLLKNGVGGGSRRGFLTEGIALVLGASVLGTFGRAMYDSATEPDYHSDTEDSDGSLAEAADFTYSDQELEDIRSNERRLESYDTELSELITLEGDRIYGKLTWENDGSVYRVENQHEKMEIDEAFWSALDDYSYR